MFGRPAAQLTAGHVIRPLNKAGHITGDFLTTGECVSNSQELCGANRHAPSSS